MLHLFQDLLLPLVLLVLYILRVMLKTHLLAFFLKPQVCVFVFVKLCQLSTKQKLRGKLLKIFAVCSKHADLEAWSELHLCLNFHFLQELMVPPAFPLPPCSWCFPSNGANGRAANFQHWSSIHSHFTSALLLKQKGKVSRKRKANAQRRHLCWQQNKKAQ